MLNKIFAAWLVMVLIAPGLVRADGDGRSGDTTLSNSPKDSPSDVVLKDRRLPPVLPGEEVGPSDQRIKVWSSSGEVPSAMVEQAKEQKGSGDGTQVILDNRNH